MIDKYHAAMFDVFMTAKNFTEATKRNYNSMLLKFGNEFAGNYKRATIDELTEYIASINGRSQKAQMYGVLKLFYNNVLKQKRKFPFIPFPKKEQRLPKIPTHNEILKMIESTQNIKHKLIISMFYATGIRLSELTSAKWSDLKHEQHVNPLSLHVNGKGNKDRIVPISKSVESLLKEYCKAYKIDSSDKNRYIFGTDKRYSNKSVEMVVKDAGKRIGIYVTPHKLRHACFTYLRDNGLDLAAIQQLAGHNSAATTMQYARLTAQKIVMPF